MRSNSCSTAISPASCGCSKLPNVTDHCEQPMRFIELPFCFLVQVHPAAGQWTLLSVLICISLLASSQTRVSLMRGTASQVPILNPPLRTACEAYFPPCKRCAAQSIDSHKRHWAINTVKVSVLSSPHNFDAILQSCFSESTASEQSTGY